MTSMLIGTVLWFDPHRSYGFIRAADGRGDIFVHASAVERSGLLGLFSGQVVAFDLASRVGASMMAVNLKLLAADTEGPS